MSSRCHFVSFGAGRHAYISTLKRLRREIAHLDPEAHVWLFDESNIAEEIEGLNVPFSDFARTHPRGFGLWIWKPWVILGVMNMAQEGDIVFYLDAGCTVHTSINSKLRYDWYQDHIQEHGNLLFDIGQAEYYWTKREVIDHFRLNEHEVNSGQVVGSIHGHLVDTTSRRMVEEWLRACTLDSGRLLQDVDSRFNQDERFIEHRNDQSVLSCLVKREGARVISDETFHYPNWDRDGDDFPFWATRKISGIPSWMGYYAPGVWPFVIKSRLTHKPLTKLVDNNYLKNL